MKLVKAGFKVLGEVDDVKVLHAIEAAGRTCYKSESLFTTNSATKFVKGLIARGHDSVLEHQSVSVRIICDRGVSHELVRHRIASFSQESTRYCNYSGGVTFVIPPWVDIEPGVYPIKWNGLIADECELATGKGSDSWWFWHCAVAERDYTKLLEHGWKPQQARAVLPNSTKTEIVITQNLRQWRHFFQLRAVGTAGTPHPQMLEITIPMLQAFKNLIPVVFDDIEVAPVEMPTGMPTGV